MFFQAFSQTEGIDKIGSAGAWLVSLLEVVIGVLVSLAFLFFFYSVLKFISTNDTTRKAKSLGNIAWGLVTIFILVSIWGIIAIPQSALFGNNFNLGLNNLTDVKVLEEDESNLDSENNLDIGGGFESMLISSHTFGCELNIGNYLRDIGYEIDSRLFQNLPTFESRVAFDDDGYLELGIEGDLEYDRLNRGSREPYGCLGGIGGEGNVIGRIFEYVDENIGLDQLGDVEETLASIVSQGIQDGLVRFQVLAKQLIYHSDKDKLEFTIATTRPMNTEESKPKEVRCISSEGGIVHLNIEMDGENAARFSNDGIRYDGEIDVKGLVDGEVYENCSINVKEDVRGANRNPIVLNNIVLGSFRKGIGLPDIFSDNNSCHIRVGLTELVGDFKNKVPSREVSDNRVVYTFETQRIKGEDTPCTLDLIDLSNLNIYVDGSPGEGNDRKIEFINVLQKMILNGYRLDKRGDYKHVLVGGGNLQTGKKEFQCGISQGKEVCAENLTGIATNKTYERICSQAAGLTVDTDSVEQTWVNDHWDYCVYRRKFPSDEDVLASGYLYVKKSIDHISLNGAQDLHVQGNYAYVVSKITDTLAIIDVSNPANPTFKSSISHNSLDGARGIHVQGNYAYVAAEDTNRLTVIDIASLPEFKGSVDLEDSMDVYVQGNYAYFTGFLQGGVGAIGVINISNPANPILEGVYPHKNLGLRHSSSSDMGLYIQGNYAYIAASTADSLTIIDISNPSNPAFKGSIKHSSLDGVQEVHVQGNYAYVASKIADTLAIIDVSNPANPTFKSSISHNSLDGARGIHVQGNYAYVAAEDTNRLTVIDISDPDSPTIKGTISERYVGKARDVHTQGNYAYVIASGRLTIVDLSKLESSIIETNEFNRLINKLIIELKNEDIPGISSVASLQTYLFSCISKGLWNNCLEEKNIKIDQ